MTDFQTEAATAGQPRLLVSRSAIEQNVRLIRGYLAPTTRLCAMIKANAYGYGLRGIARVLASIGRVDEFGVATLAEAVEIADVGVPTLVMRAVELLGVDAQRPLIEAAIRAGVTLTVNSPSAADDLARIAAAVDRRANVFVMLDTGLSRCGVMPDAFAMLVERIERLPSLRLQSVGTHLAIADVVDHPHTLSQLEAFRSATDSLAAKHPSLKRHAAASDAIFTWPASHFDVVRAGNAIFGLESSVPPSPERPLKPVARWTAPLLAIRDVPRGTGVGYSLTWTAQRETRIGLVPVGYADGYARGRSNRARVLIRGKAVPVVGRVSMDQMTVDLSDVPAATIGDEVTLIDDDPFGPVNAYTLAAIDESIAEEVMARIGPRIPRVLVD